MTLTTAPHKHTHNVRYANINDCRTACSCHNANGMEAQWNEHLLVWDYYVVEITEMTDTLISLEYEGAYNHNSFLSVTVRGENTVKQNAIRLFRCKPGSVELQLRFIGKTRSAQSYKSSKNVTEQWSTASLDLAAAIEVRDTLNAAIAELS